MTHALTHTVVVAPNHTAVEKVVLRTDMRSRRPSQYWLLAIPFNEDVSFPHHPLGKVPVRQSVDIDIVHAGHLVAEHTPSIQIVFIENYFSPSHVDRSIAMECGGKELAARNGLRSPH